MARDGSGTYSLPATLATANQVASSTTANTIMDDIAQALTDSVNKDGTKAFAGNQSLGGNKITSLGAGTALTDAAQLSQVQKGNVQQATTVAGTADAITLAFSPAITSYTTGMVIRWVSGGANTVVAPTINIDSLGAKTVKKNPGAAALAAGDLGVANTINEAVYNGTDFILLTVPATAIAAASDSAAGVVELATTTETLTGTDTARAVTPNALAALWEQGADVASDTTISLGEGGYFNITGTTTITDIDFATDKAGRVAWVKFADALTLTHGAALILPGAANITTAAGDVACFVSEGTDVVRCTVYTKANGQPVVAPSAGSAVILGTISTASGSSANLGSLNLTDYKVIELWLLGVSCSGASSELFCGNSTSDDVAVTGSVPLAAELLNGVVHIDLADGKGVSACATTASTPLWRGINFDTALSTATTTITVSHSNGNFDAGSIRVVGYK
jgi:hypothetical protein